jgi:glutamine amidotransferase
MQLMATRGVEFDGAPGLDWIPGDVVPIEVADPSLKIPHMGWNDLKDVADHPVLAGIAPGDHAYFVHSFHLRARSGDQVLAAARHGETFAAIVGRDNLIGTQFHPEKSQRVGLGLITNFLGWKP